MVGGGGTVGGSVGASVGLTTEERPKGYNINGLNHIHSRYGGQKELGNHPIGGKGPYGFSP